MIVTIVIISIILLVFLWIAVTRTDLFDRICSEIVARSKRYRSRRRPKRLILIRHGESQGNLDTHVYSITPDHAIGLTENGREQARQCGQKLMKLFGPNESILCFVSPFRRSKETCELICKAFTQQQIIKVREDPRIREQEWGNFQDLASRETTVTERQKIGRFFYRFKDGESGADVYDRVGSFMDSLYREMDNCLVPDANILIISHGLFMRLFLMRFYRWNVEKFHTLENFDNCGYCILEREDQEGSFILKTELQTYPVKEDQMKTSDNYNQQSFDEEVHPSIHTDQIGQNVKKDA